MSLFNQLGEYGFNQLIARRLTTPGPAPSPTVEPAIFPALVLEADRPEWEFLKGVRRCAGASFAAAAGAAFSQVSLVNPAGSGIIATVRTWQGFNQAQQTLAYFLQGVTAPGVGTQGRSIDGRWGAGTAGLCYVAPDSAALALPPGLAVWRLPLATTPEMRTALVLRPGDSFTLIGAVVNASMTGSFSWDERSPQPGEL